ncbi:MAG TPA: hypothetical protein VIB07_05655 [Nitrososphaera sp.]
MNWTKVGRLLPRTDLVASDEAYTREQIRKMLNLCDLRTKIVVLFLASSGMRLGGLTGLRDGDLKPLFHPEDNTKLLAVHVKVYSGTHSEYDTFVSSEAWDAYQEYRSIRSKYGEAVTADSPVLLGRFTRKSLVEGRAKRIHDATVQNLLAVVRFKAGLSVPSRHYNGRFTIKTAHAFRKFFNTAVKSVRTEWRISNIVCQQRKDAGTYPC